MSTENRRIMIVIKDQVIPTRNLYLAGIFLSDTSGHVLLRLLVSRNDNFGIIFCKNAENIRRKGETTQNITEYFNVISKPNKNSTTQFNNISMNDIENFQEYIWSKTETHSPAVVWINTAHEYTLALPTLLHNWK